MEQRLIEIPMERQVAILHRAPVSVIQQVLVLIRGIVIGVNKKCAIGAFFMGYKFFTNN